MSKFRLYAFLTHLGISILIALLSVWVVFFLWYPAPLDKAIGVTSIFFIMLGIDMTLGPLLTLVLAKKDKKGLKFDLLVIALLQLSALLYGLSSIADGRPIWIAFDYSRFEVVQARDIVIDNGEIKDKYKVQKWAGFDYTSIKPFTSFKEKTDRLMKELETGVAPSMEAKLYQPLNLAWADIRKIEKPISDLKKFNKHDDVENKLSAYKNYTGWLPLKAYEKSIVILLNTDDNEVVGIIDLRPYAHS